MLLFELERAPVHRRIVDQAVRQKRPLPPRLLQLPPEIHEGYELFMQAFWELNRAGERIPWSETQAWCVAHGVTEQDLAGDVHYVVSKLDDTFQAWINRRSRVGHVDSPLGSDASQVAPRTREIRGRNSRL